MADLNKDVTLECWSLGELFSSKKLGVPNYQRAYSWRGCHVLDLLKDTFGHTTSYLMGTVILHDTLGENQEGTLDIVDGQQRLVTLTVLLHVLCQKFNKDIGSLPLLNAQFSDGAAKVVQNTHKVITDFLAGKSPDEQTLFYERLVSKDRLACLLFNVLILRGAHALDRAYTFFDSVNSKGRSLSDFDLLKAHHLMFIPPQQEALAASHNDAWQSRDENHPYVFGTTLRRLRMWGRRNDRDSRRERPDYNEFCAVVEPEQGKGGEHVFNRYMQPAAFRSWRRVGDKIVLSMDYPALDGEALIPTEITQTIEGGDAFFLYAKRYHGLYAALFTSEAEPLSTEVAFVRNLADNMDNLYLRNAFRAVMLLYVDKFGEDTLLEAGVYVERIISAWRWEAKSLRLEGALTHVREKQLVPILLDSVNTQHACVQLRGICQMLISRQPETGTQKRYYKALATFYRQMQGKIQKKHAREITRFYNPET